MLKLIVSDADESIYLEQDGYLLTNYLYVAGQTFGRGQAGIASAPNSDGVVDAGSAGIALVANSEGIA